MPDAFRLVADTATVQAGDFNQFSSLFNTLYMARCRAHLQAGQSFAQINTGARDTFGSSGSGGAFPQSSGGGSYQKVLLDSVDTDRANMFDAIHNGISIVADGFWLVSGRFSTAPGGMDVKAGARLISPRFQGGTYVCCFGTEANPQAGGSVPGSATKSASDFQDIVLCRRSDLLVLTLETCAGAFTTSGQDTFLSASWIGPASVALDPTVIGN